MLWRSQSPALTRRPGFDPWPLHESLWCTEGSGRGFSPRILVSPCYCHSPTLYLNTATVRRTSGRAWQPFNRGVLFHVVGRSTLRLCLAAKCCGRWRRHRPQHLIRNVLACRRNPTASTCKDIAFLADRTASRSKLVACTSVSCLYPVLSSGRSRLLDGRTNVLLYFSRRLTHSVTHPHTPSPTRSRYTG